MTNIYFFGLKQNCKYFFHKHFSHHRIDFLFVYMFALGLSVKVHVCLAGNANLKMFHEVQ